MIDVAFAIIVFTGIFKGWQKGFIGALFSLMGFIIGIAAAMKLSGAVAAWLSQEYPSTAQWVPFVSFTIVFLLTAFVVNFAGKALEKAMQSVQLGWANRTAGCLVYAFLYVVIYSVFLFFLIQLKLIGTSATESSVSYTYLKEIPAGAFNWMGKWIPFFKNTFHDLQEFFGQFANKMNHK